MSIGSNELFMCTLFDNLASGDHSNRVRILHCCELVGYDKGRTINSDFVKSILDDFSALGSRALVASSSSKILGSETMARAIAMR